MRFRALEVLDAVDMSRHVTDSRKWQDSLNAPSIFRRGTMLVLLCNKM